MPFDTGFLGDIFGMDDEALFAKSLELAQAGEQAPAGGLLPELDAEVNRIIQSGQAPVAPAQIPVTPPTTPDQTLGNFLLPEQARPIPYSVPGQAPLLPPTQEAVPGPVGGGTIGTTKAPLPGDEMQRRAKAAEKVLAQFIKPAPKASTPPATNPTVSRGGSQVKPSMIAAALQEGAPPRQVQALPSLGQLIGGR